MSTATRIEVHLTGTAVPPPPGMRIWNAHRGGPEVLLGWIETQLGLRAARDLASTRITQYAAALEAVPGASYADSLNVDRWATAAELLARREELRMAGWKEDRHQGQVPLVRDLGRAAATGLRLPQDMSDRLVHVLAALDAGQVLPPHECVLHDSAERWPALWRAVLARLNTRPAQPASPQAGDGTALAVLQKQLLAGTTGEVKPDRTMCWVRSQSTFAACEAIASLFARKADLLPHTTICCENAIAALTLDACLARMGLPTAGASVDTASHPALQVLPLALRLCWEPVDPALLLDFLSLPLGPIPRRVARDLSDALAEQPGFGSEAWERAWRGHREEDPDGTLARTLDRWLVCERRPHGEPLPVELIQDRCGLVAQWAAGRAQGLEDGDEANSDVVGALWVAAAQASELRELVATQGDSLSEPQLERMLRATLDRGVTVRPHREAAGGPCLVRSLAEVQAPCRRLIWLGLGTQERPVCRWTALEIKQLGKEGIDLDDGTRRLSALRNAERRGLCRVTESVIAVTVPFDAEMRPHPIWRHIQEMLDPEGKKPPLGLEDLLTEPRGSAAQPLDLPVETFEMVRPPPPRLLWSVPPGLVGGRGESSATELETRLACPLKWVFTYAARLRAAPTARLPDDVRLKGTFCHGVLSAAFGAGGPLPSEAAAVRAVERLFDGRLPLDAALLAQPGRFSDRVKLREQLLGATRTLVKALAAGGYTVAGMELGLTCSFRGTKLTCRIDCLARREDGEEAIIDFKYGGAKRYEGFLQEGRAVQLATYAHARKMAGGREYPRVAYLVIAEGLLCTPRESILRGQPPSNAVEGPAIDRVWREFASALKEAESWLTEGAPIPCRPLQEPDDRPPGSAMVIEPPANAGPGSPCRYCDFNVLCGLRELR